jgi:hypothetical protein
MVVIIIIQARAVAVAQAVLVRMVKDRILIRKLLLVMVVQEQLLLCQDHQ